MPIRTRAFSRSAPEPGGARVRAITSGGIGDELLPLPALRFLADVLPAGALEVRLADYEGRHELFEELLSRKSVRVRPLSELTPDACAGTGRCAWLLDLDSRWAPRPQPWLKGTQGTFSVKAVPGRGPIWRAAFAVAFSLARHAGFARGRGWSSLSQRYRVVDRAGIRRAIPAALERRLRSARAPIRVALSPGGHAPWEKRWPLVNFARVAMGLLEVGCDVLVLGDRSDAHLGRDLARMVGPSRPDTCGRLVDLTGRTRLADVPAVLASSNLHLACDNGLLHVGGALDRPQVGLYLGASSRHLTPGRRDRRLFSGDGNGMDAISVAKVARACADVLATSRP